MTLNVRVRIVGRTGKQAKATWPDGWPLPRPGDSVAFDIHYYCQHVAWYPQGDTDSKTPYIYLVFSEHRP